MIVLNSFAEYFPSGLDTVLSGTSCHQESRLYYNSSDLTTSEADLPTGLLGVSTLKGYNLFAVRVNNLRDLNLSHDYCSRRGLRDWILSQRNKPIIYFPATHEIGFNMRLHWQSILLFANVAEWG